MSSTPVSLFRRLIDDAAMFPPGNASAPIAVESHLRCRSSWFADLIGPLVVPDQRLAEVGRAVAATDRSVQVSVVNSAGAGGLIGLAARNVAGVEVVAVETALRDLDDLAGAAARVVAAATELDESVRVFVELPFARGWERAAETVEAAGLAAKIRTGGMDPELFPTADQLAEQLSTLIEIDLPFKATAGLHHAWPNESRNAAGETLPQHGLASLMIAIHALIEGADVSAAAGALRITDHDQLSSVINGWTEADAARLRRRFHSFGCCGVGDPVADLVQLGLLTGPEETG
ncbi:hypothetical protein GCM10009841_12430 [Microlunatus panaciterrae]|uniref:Uncharacterized protein n=1 Tax=Microlunatus panaciterrae TaxID=400768 RepID=A0ABS2RNQ0_9ACTN|nr:hypothetical protein [Microlunatus panaciterrae]MBM7799801.1 hypothetical protein [Microlunatus panaciterrae]